MSEHPSTSEDHGIAVLSDSDLQVLSVGISTGGVAEIRMAQANPRRHIVATTIDEKGITFANEFIAEKGFAGQIETKLEDVSEPLPYDDARFDYIYARLVLHYLSEEKLKSTLKELRRVLKPNGKFFVVVRSSECLDATREGAQFDPETHLTSGSYIDKDSGNHYSYTRFFHTEASIKNYVREAGFDIDYVKTYDEYLYIDFMHTRTASMTDNIIELLATKK